MPRNISKIARAKNIFYTDMFLKCNLKAQFGGKWLIKYDLSHLHQGDSGGPLAYRRSDAYYELIGVVSFGKPCARIGFPAVYGRVTGKALETWGGIAD